MIPGSNPILNASLSFVQGKAWGGIPTLTILDNGSAPAAAVASCEMFFKENAYAPTRLLTISNGSGITITSPSGWLFTVPKQLLDLSVGTYFWAFDTVDINNIPECYLTGEITVLPPY